MGQERRARLLGLISYCMVVVVVVVVACAVVLDKNNVDSR